MVKNGVMSIIQEAFTQKGKNGFKPLLPYTFDTTVKKSAYRELLKQFEFSDTDIIRFTIDKVGKKVTLSIEAI